MAGCVQWWPARTQTPSASRIWATSWAWTPSSVNERMPARSGGGGPYSVTPGIADRSSQPGAADLVPRDRVEVAAQGEHVHRPVRGGLGAVAHHDRVMLVGPARDRSDVVHGAERVRDVRGGDELDVGRSERLERLLIE